MSGAEVNREIKEESSDKSCSVCKVIVQHIPTASVENRNALNTILTICATAIILRFPCFGVRAREERNTLGGDQVGG